MATDSGELPSVLQPVTVHFHADASQVLADADYRCEATFEQPSECPSELVVALGREGKEQITIDSNKYPCTAPD